MGEENVLDRTVGAAKHSFREMMHFFDGFNTDVGNGRRTVCVEEGQSEAAFGSEPDTLKVLTLGGKEGTWTNHVRKTDGVRLRCLSLTKE